jgi:hypothetical protein
MVFPESVDDADVLWSAIAASTRAGQLGWATKMSLRDRARPALLVFTKDHADDADRERVRNSLRELLDSVGVASGDIRYKTDAATAAGVYSKQDVGGRSGAGAGAQYYNGLGQREMCKYYMSSVGCRFGSACKYRHA